jgi:uncharacterized membrane protein YeaQ/YmgE (transglycosylase-associated protein family)
MNSVIFTQSLWWQGGTLLAGTIMTALLLAVAHWFPAQKKMGLIWRYVYGVGTIVLGFAIWRLLNGDWRTVVGLIVIASVGGAVVVLAYRYDHLYENAARAALAQAADDELRG